MRRIATIFGILTALVFGIIALPLIAQESGEEQKSALLRFVEDRLSAPGRRISLNGIEGVLSEQATIDEITISDTDGVWLRIENASIDWNQSALLTGRLEIRSLSADSITWTRRGKAEGGDLPSPEASSFEVPEFPIAVVLQELAVPSVTFGEEVFGLAADIALEGSFVLEGGNLDTRLDVERLDGPGGSLDLAFAYVKDTNTADIDLSLVEPENGVVANLLNIEGRPPITLNVAGEGPVGDLQVDLGLDAGGERALTGTGRITQADAGLRLTANMGGPIARLVAPAYREFFGQNTTLATGVTLREAGGIAVDFFRLDSGQLNLAASAETGTDGFVQTLVVNARIASDDGQPVLLPVPGASTRVQSADLSVNFGATGSEAWQATLDIRGFEHPTLSAEAARLSLDGAAVDLASPADRRVTFNVDGLVSGISSDNAEIEAALGDEMGVGIAGFWNAGGPVEIAEARFVGHALTAAMAGAIDDFVFDGRIALNTPSLAPFSGVVDRELAGAVDLVATGTLGLVGGRFKLELSGEAQDLALGLGTADRIFAGTTQLAGSLARDTEGFTADRFSISNQRMRLAAHGTIASDAADFDFSLDLDDLALLSEDASGPLHVAGTARGVDGPIDLELTANVRSGTLVGRDLRQAVLAFTGTLADADISGDIDGEAFLSGHRVGLTAAIATREGGMVLDDLLFNAGPTHVTGNLTRQTNGLLDGRLAFSSTDISIAAALALIEAEGAAEADIVLSAGNNEQSVEIASRLDEISSEFVAIGSGRLNATIDDLFGVPRMDGTLEGTDIRAAGVDIATLSATADHSAGATAFTADAALDNSTDLGLTGTLSPLEEGYRLALTRADLSQEGLEAGLAEPAALTVQGESVSLDTVVFTVGGGRVTATGTAGQALDISVDIVGVPLNLANAIRPELRLAGMLEGSARITGSASAPRAGFEISGSGIRAAALEGYGAAPLELTASGSYSEGRVNLQTARVSGPQELAATFGGTVPLAGRGLDLSVAGTVPLSLLNRQVGARGTQLAGTLGVDVQVSGSLGDPAFSGSISGDQVAMVDPASNIRLTGIMLRAGLSGQRLTIDQLSGNVATGGSLSASGAVSLDAAAGYPADLSIRLNSARYADGNLFVATLNGDISVTGPLATNVLIGGDLAVARAEITVPETFGSIATFIDVDHVAVPRDVASSLARARADETARERQTQAGGPQLDLTLTAPNQVFVRGRGLDAELGGSVRLTGPISNISPVGGFELIRGRLNILGERITFDEGLVTLAGDLDPYLDFMARIEADEATIFITATGRASDLEIGFSSQPELPDEEILSRLIFNRSTGELSPLQIARLAAAAAELAGGADTSLVDGLRQAAGLDDLDIVTDAEGNATLRAGRYIQDNIYLGVEAGSQGESRVTVDLDLTEDLKARAAAGSDGETSVGIFYEKDF